MLARCFAVPHSYVSEVGEKNSLSFVLVLFELSVLSGQRLVDIDLYLLDPLFKLQGFDAFLAMLVTFHGLDLGLFWLERSGIISI